MTASPRRPPRTLGIALAIVTSTLLFSVLPLFQAVQILVLRQRLTQASAGMGEDEALFSGGDFSGVLDGTLALQIVAGVAFLILAIMAWRGRPAWVRVAMMGAIVVLTTITVVISLSAALAAPTVAQGIDSGGGAARSLNWARFAFTIAIALYVVWYFSRAPARAFFRGRYATPPFHAD